MTEDPDLKVAGLSIWVQSREFPDSEDYWDGNWLNIRAVVEAPGCLIETAGPWLRNDEVAAFEKSLAQLNQDLAGEAGLDCIEPVLDVQLRCNALGHIEVVVAVTPDHLSQQHRLTFTIDQSYLAPMLKACQRILARFPIVGSRDAN